MSTDEELEYLANLENNVKALISKLILESKKDSLTGFCIDAKLYPSVIHKFLYNGGGLTTKTLEKIGEIKQ